MGGDICTAGLITAVAGKKIIENILTDIYEIVKSYVKKPIQKYNIKGKSSELQKQIKSIRMVKTLWQIDKAVDIKSFYCDSNIIEDKKRKVVRYLSDFKTNGNILIEGIAGQGKSIFLRYICSNTFAVSKKIPIFVELRKISSSESLLDHVGRYLEILEVKIDESIFKELARSGKFVLFLDGFDEVNLDNKERLISEIDHIGKICEQLQIIVTSRPNAGMEMVPQFTVVKLDNLRNDEYQKVIKKLSDCPIISGQLISQIKQNKANIKDLLCTPLMVTLLLISYKSYQEIPDQLSDFYDSLFQLLLQRHDGVKPGYKRHRCCSINDHQYRKVFEGLCFESKNKPVLSFSFDNIYSFAEKSLANAGIKEDPEKFIEDIVKVTCLILKEGGEYRFIHRSLQEYYAASCIRHKPESVAKQFYAYCLDNELNGSWAQELRFLSEIDKYRFNKYFTIPSNVRFLNESCNCITANSSNIEIDKCVKNIIGRARFRFTISNDNKSCHLSGISEPGLFGSNNFVIKLFEIEYNIPEKIIDSCIENLYKENIKNKDFNIRSISHQVVMNISDLYQYSIGIEGIRRVVVAMVVNARKNLATAKKYVELEESFESTFKFDFS